MAADDELLRSLHVDGAVREDGKRVEQAQDFLEGFLPPVVRGGRGQDEGLRRRRQRAGQLIILGAGVRGIVDLIDDHGIPADLLQLRAILRRLERVHGDDDAWEVGKGVLRCRQFLADLLDALAVQAHQRDGETRPQFLLELLHDVLGRDDEDALSPAAADELRQDHADLQRLAQTDGIREQNARADALIGERRLHGGELIIQRVRQHLRGYLQLLLVQRHRCAAQRGLQPQAGVAKLR